MIIIEHIETYGMEAAFRGMRNPLNSWDRSDSCVDEDGNFAAGVKDLKLAENLCRSGSDHRKFMRQIMISMDITAPLYWWKEFDTYKVGTVANSCSTMHTLHKRPIVLEDFSTDGMGKFAVGELESLIQTLNIFREKYLEKGEEGLWRSMIQLLPCSYNQKRTVTANYEVIRNMVGARAGHKLTEWREFCRKMEELPYYAQLIGTDGKG